MKLELFIGIIVIIFAANIYYDGKILLQLKSYTKYYKIGIIAFMGLCLYLYLKKAPENAKHFFVNANEYIKYLPVDRQTTSILTPIIDLTGKALGDSIKINYNKDEMKEEYMKRYNMNGNIKTKRVVSETKKKFVAANQNWKCMKCNKQLPAWFEVDHKIKLEYGGSNEVNNLEALCRDCHGRKTALENL